MEKTWLMVQMEYSPNGKGIWPQGNIVSWFIAPMEKAWFYKRLFFEVVIVMARDKKYSMKDAMSNLILCITCDKSNFTSSIRGI